MRRIRSRGASRLRLLALALAAVLIAGVVVLVVGTGGSAGGAQASTSTTSSATTTTSAGDPVQLTSTTALSPTGVPSVRVGAPLKVRPVAAGFLGLSLEYYVITQYAGTDPDRLNPVFLALVRNLTPGARPVLRIGGDSTDWGYIPTDGVKRVPGLKVDITPQVIKVLAAMTRALGAKLVLGINDEADSTKLAAHIADALVSAVGASHVEALELGNEPELYDALGWYANAAGQPVLGRAKPYTLADYGNEFARMAKVLAPVGLAGPASGSVKWVGDGMSSFVRHAADLKLVTVHTYPMQRCGTRPGLPSYPTIAKLLAASSTLGLARAQVPYAAAAHRAGKLIRVDEINSVSCFGVTGVSNTYAAALWSLETAFQFARLGFDGLNLPTLPAAAYRLWNLSGDSASVAPEYYGLLDFAQAVPPDSRILATPDTGTDPQTFAVRTPSGATHVVVVNPGSARRLAVAITGARGEGVLTHLEAPSLSATGGVSLSGQSFGTSTRTGTLAGAASGVAVRPVDGAYVLNLPAHSATTLSVG